MTLPLGAGMVRDRCDFKEPVNQILLPGRSLFTALEGFTAHCLWTFSPAQCSVVPGQETSGRRHAAGTMGDSVPGILEML